MGSLEMCRNKVSARSQALVTWLADVGAQCVHNAVEEFGSANLLLHHGWWRLFLPYDLPFRVVVREKYAYFGNLIRHGVYGTHVLLSRRRCTLQISLKSNTQVFNSMWKQFPNGPRTCSLCGFKLFLPLPLLFGHSFLPEIMPALEQECLNGA